MSDSGGGGELAREVLCPYEFAPARELEQVLEPLAGTSSAEFGVIRGFWRLLEAVARRLHNFALHQIELIRAPPPPPPPPPEARTGPQEGSRYRAPYLAACERRLG